MGNTTVVDAEAAAANRSAAASSPEEAAGEVDIEAAGVDNVNTAETDAEVIQAAPGPDEHGIGADEAVVEPGSGADGAAEVDLEAVEGLDAAAVVAAGAGALGIAGVAAAAVEAGGQTRGWDDTVVTHTSGCERMLQSLFCAFCVSPLVIVAMCFLLGWNERRAVCAMRAISEGKDVVQSPGCRGQFRRAADSSGQFIMFSCDLERASLPNFSATGDFNSYVSFQGTGMRTDAEMFQCVENSRTETRKDSVGGGETKITTYYYTREWSASVIDSRNFRAKGSNSWQQECNVENPSWPAGVPDAGSKYAEDGVVGGYTVPSSNFLDQVPLSTPLSSSGVPSEWQADGFVYTMPAYRANKIGDVRVSFYGNDWSQTTMTVIGQNNNGLIGRWTASDSWLCSGFQLGELRVGSYSRDQFFASLQAESSTVTWLLRFVAAIVMWFAFCSIFKPLEVAADCIPFVGPYVGNCISCIIPVITCPLACACSVGVAGAVWVVMRPIVGSLMMFVCVAICCAGCGLDIYARNKKPIPSEAQAPEGGADAPAQMQMPEGGQDAQDA